MRPWSDSDRGYFGSRDPFFLVWLVAFGYVLSVSIGAANAGPNSGGVLIVHADTTSISSTGFCGLSPLSACSLAVTQVPLGTAPVTTLHAYAAFPPDASPRLKGITFGVEYDSTKFVLLDRGFCGDTELAGTGWPGPHTGTSVVWDTAQTAAMTDVYWIRGYAYSYTPGDTTSFRLAGNPEQNGGFFADDTTPSVLDPIAAYGELGFGTSGDLPCPEPGGQENPVLPGTGVPPLGPHLPDALLIRFAPGIVSFSEDDRDSRPFFIAQFDNAVFSDSTLRGLLSSFGTESFETVAPEWRYIAGTQQYDLQGLPVTLIDFTDVYRVQLDGRTSADSVIAALDGNEGIVYAESVPAVHLYFPSDPYFTDEWYLNNTGQVWNGAPCDPYYDMNMPEAWGIWPMVGSKIGIADHPMNCYQTDLRPYICRNLSRSFVPGYSWCAAHIGGAHGTFTAGSAAAGTDNYTGISSVCNLFGDHMDSVLVSLCVVNMAQLWPPDSLSMRSSRALAYVCNGVGGAIRVVNFSVGAELYKNCVSYNRTERDAFRNAFLCDINLVCSAGNNRPCPAACEPPADTCFVYPAAHEFSLAVSALDCRGGRPADFNHGSYVDLVAPACGIYYPDGDSDYEYAAGCGTSFSAPMVSGIVALLLGADPTLTNEDCCNLLRLTASRVPGGSSVDFGAGFVRADTALIQLRPPRHVVRGSASGCTDSPGPAYWAQLLNVEGINDTENPQPFWIRRHELSTAVTLATDKLVPYCWGRGKFSTGWGPIEENGVYDGKAHAGFAEVADWDGGYNVVFHAFTYEVFDTEGGNFLGWRPYEPGTTPYAVDYSFVELDPAVDSAPEPSETVPFALNAVWDGSGDEALRLLIPGSGTCDVEVFDAAGRFVRELLRNAPVGRGTHELRWDQRTVGGAPAPSGIYFVRATYRRTGRSATDRARLVVVR